jgi:hypothetical protein
MKFQNRNLRKNFIVKDAKSKVQALEALKDNLNLSYKTMIDFSVIWVIQCN